MLINLVCKAYNINGKDKFTYTFVVYGDKLIDYRIIYIDGKLVT